jgi:hypothetical protein
MRQSREKLASRMTQGEILEAQRMARNWKPQPQGQPAIGPTAMDLTG